MDLLHKHVAGIILFGLSINVSGQDGQIGLLCPEQGQPPRIFYVDLRTSSSQHFSLSQGKWIEDYYDPEILVNQLILKPVRYSGSGSSRYIRINRTTLEVDTYLDVDNKYSNRRRQFSCSLHTIEEIREIAAREFDRLNNIRAF